MTTNEDQVLTQAPKPRSKPPVKRKPPPPRAKRPDPVAGGANGDVVANATDQAAELAAMRAEIEQLKARGRFVEGTPTNTVAVARVAGDEELTPWQRQVRERTAPTPSNLDRRERAYNYPQKLYMKPDGSVQSLQGDPVNYKYYTDQKKFHALSDEEVHQYLTVERPKIVKLQRQKAGLINAIRRAVAVDPALTAGLDPAWETDLDKMSIQELQAQVEEIAGTPTASGAQRKMMRRIDRLQAADDAALEAESERMLRGVERTPSRSAQTLFEQIQQGTRSIEVTRANAAQFT